MSKTLIKGNSYYNCMTLIIYYLFGTHFAGYCKPQIASKLIQVFGQAMTGYGFGRAETFV